MSPATTLLPAVAGTIAISAFGILAGLLFLGIDRKFAAHMQARIGPPIRQPFIDTMKLLRKESVVPDNAIPWLFNFAPILALASSITILLYLPIGSLMPVLGAYGDLVLIMYLLTVPALAMVAGGFASGSPYATVGAQREMVTMMAYEFPLAIAIIAIAWRLSMAGIAYPFSLATIATNPFWGVMGPLGIIGGIILLLILAWVTPAELSRVPFDSQEAETELAGGLLVEYSGRNLALFYLAQGVRTIAMAAIAVAVFLPWNISTFVAMSPALALAVDFLFFLAKVLLVVFVSVSLIRVSMARFKITQIVSVYWIWFGGLGILGLLLIVLDATFGVW
ncbi:MAG: NADH-quinone oxidoreductase subunit H [Methanomicrobiaceae archaeon]|uniref:Membrane bound hydrogenase, mbhm subunit n=1 Tax=hydrocarbon metagenome TaxID=938273 RepID=A0A0W8FHD4_9ZZZZ|nr:NADH-quinone oxidoreductase subunit H [Methanomicrobiaceae archaeon]MDD5419946.1 NADH-quinone oxidoreductase subunit H [Methanomicrobiaceae archaeon]